VKQDTIPVLKDLVLVGGGHSHVGVLKSFGMKPIPGVRLTLICRDVHTPYSGMLPGLVAGHYTFDETHIDLGPLSQFAGARFYHDDAIGIDTVRRVVLCRDRPPVPYDLLSINVGSAPATWETPGADGNVVPVKPINKFVAHWERLRERILLREDRTRIGVVGGGAGGVELILAAQHRLKSLLATQGRTAEHLDFHLVTEEAEILTSHNPLARKKFGRIFAERGITLHTGMHVDSVSPGEIKTKTETLALDEILWVTRAGAAAWVRESGLDVDERGFMRVDDTLQSVSHPGIFGAGDIAAMINHPRPKAGVFAVRQGPPLTRNLRRALVDRPLKPFAPQRDWLSLVSTGDKYAVASRGNLSVEGAWVWHWKDWIDQRFMRKYNELPEMDTEEKSDVPHGLAGAEVIKEISAIAMRCGGCGAKVGATVLNRALSQLQPVPRDDVLIGLHEPDDAAVVKVPPGKVMVHTVDSFRAMIDDPYVFGKIAANHSLGDIFAMGGEPQTALAIATIPYGIEEKVEDLLSQMMAGAMEVLKDANTALVGGHTSEGTELSLGFAINGLIDQAKVMRKGGMQPGDRLVLTKAIGTGTLFAADMRLQAKGRWISGALDSMQQSNRDGAICLTEHGAHACTDVTGFGLLGHLVEMTKPSEVDVELDLGAIPLLEGAQQTVDAGITSTLQPQNLRLRRAIANLGVVGEDSRFPLIFDPQTAGGLLASVPGDRAEACVADLRKLGYERTAIIGTVLPQGNTLEPVRVLV
jgi:selenide,water dikinase